MSDLQAGLSATPVVLTVELPLQSVLSGQRPPPPLAPAQADILLGAIADDLTRILGGGLEEFGLIMPAALYDLPELVRPGLPMVEALHELYRGSLRGGLFIPQLIAIGGHDHNFPVASLAPQRRPGSGPLMAIPALFIGERPAVEKLQARLETLLLEKGQASAQTESVIREQYGLAPENLAYATFNDLCALLKIQLGHGGMEPLWQLLESALYRPEQIERVELPTGNRFAVRADAAYTPVHSFESWTEAGGDLEGYLNWIKQQRVYEAGLAAHGLTVHWLRPGTALDAHCVNSWQRLGEQYALASDVLVEPPGEPGVLDGAGVVLLTEHAAPSLGPVAYTVLVQSTDGRVLHLANEYPLNLQALRDLQQRWARIANELGLELQLSRPRRMVLSEDGGHLIPFLDIEGEPH